MYNRLRPLASSLLLRQLTGMTAALAAGQAITLAAVPILTRLYGPAALGALGTFLAIVTVLAAVSSCRYELSIVGADTNVDAVRLVRLSVHLLLSSALVYGLVIAFVRPFRLADLLSLPVAAVWLLPAAIVATGLHEVIAFWRSRSSEFGIVGWSRITRSASTVVLQIGAGLVGQPSALRLVGAAVAGQFLGAAVCLRGKVRALVGSSDERFMASYSEFPSTASKYSDSAKNGTPYALLYALSRQAPLLLTALFFGARDAGLVAVASKLMLMPASLVGAATRQVFLKRLTVALRRGEDLANLYWRYVRLLVLVGVGPLALIGLAGPRAFGMVLGEEWASAAAIARWLILPSIGALTIAPASAGLIAVRRQGLLWRRELVVLLLIVGLFGGVVVSGGSAVSAIGLSVTAAFCVDISMVVITRSALSRD